MTLRLSESRYAPILRSVCQARRRSLVAFRGAVSQTIDYLDRRMDRRAGALARTRLAAGKAHLIC
jgi:hypothetical protein